MTQDGYHLATMFNLVSPDVVIKDQPQRLAIPEDFDLAAAIVPASDGLMSMNQTDTALPSTRRLLNVAA